MYTVAEKKEIAMQCEKHPGQYIVRVWTERSGNMEFRPFAYSAEDANFQIEFHLKKSSVTFNVNYVGPVNPNCQCLNKCYCGIREGRS